MLSCLINKRSKPDFRRSFLIFSSFIVLFFLNTAVQAQDYHFSQFYAAPLMTNPANTGMSAGDIRIANIYRNQWARIGAPYETFSTSLDTRLIISNQSFGIGGVILHDQSSSFNLSANEFLLSLSYSKEINNQQFTFGLQYGFVSRSYNLEGMTFGSQFDPLSQVFNQAIPNLESGLNNRLHYFDLNAGIFWRTRIHYIIPSAGISVSHLNMPVEKFSTSSSGTRLPIKLSFNGEVTLPLNSNISLTPCVLYSYTPGAHEFLLGSLGDYSLEKLNGPVKKVYAVTMLRINPPRDIDAFILGGGVEFLKFNLGITYDFNISPLRTAANFNGAFEISLIYMGRRSPRKNVNQPCYIIN
jgi:type IX secretion system PorP/SprF family membrane protein